MNNLSLTEIIEATNANFISNGQDSDKIKTTTGITTDSRKIVDGVIFIALNGEKFNGEDFAEESLKKGAVAVIISNHAKKIPDNGIVLQVENTLTAYQQIAKIWRERFQIPIIALTGSSGKTTTKDLTAAALHSLGNIQKTTANYNNEIGVPLTLLGINDKHKAAVVEIGMRGLHQIEELAKIVEPNIGIVTNVNETHIELLGSIDNIAKAKSELVDAIPSGGTIILNADNPHTLNMKNLAKDGVKIITCGLDNPADLTAEHIHVESESTTFVLKYKGEYHDFEIPLIGRHNVSNALLAIAAGLTVGLSVDEIRHGFSTLVTTRMRFEVIRREGLTIINDAYNASPASMRASIKTVSEVFDGRRIAVLGDMFELGKISEKVHREVGKEVAEHNFDILITVGELGKFIAAGAKDFGMEKIFSVNTNEEAAKKIVSVVHEGDIILFKASHGMQLEKIIEMI